MWWMEEKDEEQRELERGRGREREGCRDQRRCDHAKKERKGIEQEREGETERGWWRKGRFVQTTLEWERMRRQERERLFDWMKGEMTWMMKSRQEKGRRSCSECWLQKVLNGQKEFEKE